MDLSFQNVDQLCASVDLAAKEPVVDLSRITFFSPFSLVYLGMFLRYHNSNGKGFKVRAPDDPTARAYLARQNFWERFNFDPECIKNENLRRLTSSTSLNDILDIEKRDEIAEDIAKGVLQVLRRNSVAVPVGLVAELMCELVDNFARHSERTLAAVLMQYYPNLRRVVLAIGDCGVGIRSSLAYNPRYTYLAGQPHHVAALKAFEPLVSRCSEGGTGLTEVRDEIMGLQGQLTLATGDGYVTITARQTLYGQMAYELPGVQIQLSIPERSVQ